MRQLFILLQAQRLSHGFQLCVARHETAASELANSGTAGSTLPSLTHAAETSSRLGNSAASAGERRAGPARLNLAYPRLPLRLGEDRSDAQDDEHAARWLCLGKHFHKLQYDFTSHSVQVEIYR